MINWSNDTATIRNFVRGLSPYPGAFTHLNGKLVKVLKVTVEKGEHASPGTLMSDGKTYLKFSASDGTIAIEELQMEGKKRMRVEEFLRGYQIKTT